MIGDDEQTEGTDRQINLDNFSTEIDTKIDSLPTIKYDFTDTNQAATNGEGRLSRWVSTEGKYQDVQFVNVLRDKESRSLYTRFEYEGVWPQGKVLLSDGKNSSYEISPDVFALTTKCVKHQAVLIQQEEPARGLYFRCTGPDCSWIDHVGCR